MSCECRTDQRVMLIKSEDSFPEFHELVQLRHWSMFDTDTTLVVNVGGDSKYLTGRDVINFLRTVLPAPRFQSLKARWLLPSEASPCSGCRSGGEVNPSSTAYLDLDEFAPLDATPLVRLMQSGRIQTFFQPIFLQDGESVWGYECLMRGVADDGSWLMPKQLLDWAAQERLTFMLDRICRETHLKNSAAMLPDDVAVLVNFLPTAIYEPAFCLKTTIAAAKSANIEPKRVIFEVVETEKVNDSDHLASILDEYRKTGFRVALDDVGSGFAGLSMLAHLSPDLIKIDRELVRGAVESEMHRIIVRALTQIARDSGCLILAEGVETEVEFSLMKSFGVDLFQGFYLGRPDPSAVSKPSASSQLPATSQTCKLMAQNQQLENGSPNHAATHHVIDPVERLNAKLPCH